MPSAGLRICGAAVIATAAWYLPWLLDNLRQDVIWLAAPFVWSHVVFCLYLLLSIANHWTRCVPPLRPATRGSEDLVGVIVPTCGEPPEMVRSTVRSVLDQDWPLQRLAIVISDDSRSSAVAAMAAELQQRYPAAVVLYNRPPPLGAPERGSAAKAGNLNSALALLDREFPGLRWLETRDADDEVVRPDFLRQCIGQLQHEPGLAYVQTIKQACVAEGDPFDNLTQSFYCGNMYARNAANAVFPCGSGLVWRRSALAAIGNFPTWNLVEDVQSGVDALRAGWQGLYLAIVGARAQHAPHDLANYYKQRGTWALDTLRLLIWGDLRGLRVRQYLHFAHIGLMYLQSLPLVIFLACPVLGLAFGVFPLEQVDWSYPVHMCPFVLAAELFAAQLCVPATLRSAWRARVLAIGLAPVFIKALVLAICSGVNRKPAYRVTRKVDEVSWHWREALPQLGAAGAITAAAACHFVAARPGHYDAASLVWAAYFLVLLAGFLPLSWFGMDVRDRLTARSRIRPARARPD